MADRYSDDSTQNQVAEREIRRVVTASFSEVPRKRRSADYFDHTGIEQMADYKRMLSRVEELGNQGFTCEEIAENLDREGFRTAQLLPWFEK